MSELSYMEKLLDGVEVEWKTLDDVVEFRRGSFPQPYGDSNWYDGKDSMPFVQVADVSDEGFSLHKKTKHQISVLAQPRSVFVETGTVIVSLQGTIGRVAITQYDCYIDRTLAIFTNYKADINKKYFAYQLKTKFDIEKKYARGSTLKTITKAEFSKFQIPIPPLEIQAEIVRILDAFTELTAELTAELVARKQQYGYYHDQFLTFNDNEVEWKTLEDISVIFDSLHQTPQYTENGLSMIRVTNIKGGLLDLNDALKVSNETFKMFTKRYAPQKFDLVMSRVGSYGNVSIVPLDNAVCMGQNTVVIHPLINKKFLYYVLSSEGVKSFIEKNVAGGSQKTLSLKSIKAIPIPIPSEDQQTRIVTILDKFDALTTSLTEGLPREIALRQQQYEYYRELLLSFPKPEVVEHD